MQSSLLSFAVPAPKRARRSGLAQLGHRHAISARGVVQGGGPDKLCGKKCYTNHCKKKISTVGPAPAWWSQGTALTGEEVLRHGMAHGRRCQGRDAWMGKKGPRTQTTMAQENSWQPCQSQMSRRRQARQRAPQCRACQRATNRAFLASCVDQPPVAIWPQPNSKGAFVRASLYASNTAQMSQRANERQRARAQKQHNTKTIISIINNKTFALYVYTHGSAWDETRTQKCAGWGFTAMTKTSSFWRQADG